MIGFLRFVGVMNAAIWLGGTVFFAFTATSALASPELQRVLGEPNFSYFSRGVTQVVHGYYYGFQSACLIVAWLHLLAEWLYFGRPSRKISFSLLSVLLALVLCGGYFVQPRLEKLNPLTVSGRIPPPQRSTALLSYQRWQTAAALLNVVMIGGLMIYLWRTAHPVNTPRFISSVKFRG